MITCVVYLIPKRSLFILLPWLLSWSQCHLSPSIIISWMWMWNMIA